MGKIKKETIETKVLREIKEDGELTSIHITGIEPQQGETTYDVAQRFLIENLKLEEKVKIRAFISSKTNGTKRLKIILPSQEEKSLVLSKGSNLKGTNVRMDAVHIPSVGQAEYELRKIAYQKRANGQEASYSHRLGLYVDGNLHTTLAQHLYKTFLLSSFVENAL